MGFEGWASMKRICKMAHVVFLTALFLCACAGEKTESSKQGESSDVAPEVSVTDTAEKTETQIDYSNMVFSYFEGNLNILKKKTEEIYIPVTDKIMSFEDGVLEVSVELTYDASEVVDKAPVYFYAFSDGSFLDIALDDGQFAEYAETELKSKTINRIPVKIRGRDDAFAYDISRVTVIALVDPAYFADKGVMSQPCNVAHSSVAVKTDGFEKRSDPIAMPGEEDFLQGSGETELNVGSMPEKKEEGESEIWKNAYGMNSEPVKELSRDKEEIFVQAGSAIIETEDETDSYIFVLCDGKILSAFNGEKVLKIEESYENKTFNHRIAKEDCPEAGDHAMYAIRVLVTKNAEGAGMSAVISSPGRPIRVI